MSDTTAITKAGRPAAGGGNIATFYSALVERTTSPQKRQNLTRIWGALEAIRSEAERAKQRGKYTVAEVRRRLESAGTPIGESTILNKGQGDDYRALIRAYDEQYGAKPTDATVDDALALEVTDPRLQARIRIVLQQNRALQHRLDVVHRDYHQLVAESARPALLSAPTSTTLRAPSQDFSEREIRAVRRFLERMADHLWQIDEGSGAILDHRGDEIAEPGFAQALRRIAGL